MTTPTDMRSDHRPPLWQALAIAILPVVAASIAGSAATVPQIPTWYAGLAKPPFNPPNWIFAPIWTMLFALIALGAFRILRLAVGTPGRRRALLVYHLQLLFNIGWSFAFFGANSPLAGLAVILPLLVLIAATIAAFRPLDRLASNLLWPYLAWVAFAALLNTSIWWLNG
ncbi:MAG: tryptophan-rich sensory protein [Bosea sp.]|uniref:TspO/MBR family protein n=1 Tax=Bosea sp. (in: a-proteobacteria) TaxID=1871050 RepID=UPI001ACC1D57|nr:TspO/MBR family protein [Bosea sp. (in: a-proteobacteria)]MBN9453177.1 tryptophan-rich sensory protein [Bosea sp. (in: a-proteobacteria)]